MAPRLSWIAFGVLLIFISSENVFSKKLHLVKKKEETVAPGKKSDIGNFDLKAYARSIKASDCKNLKPKLKCAKMMRETPNACLVNQKYMSDNCKLACRFCSPFSAAQKTKIERKCKDLHPKCRAWAKNKDCLHYVAFMMDVCKRSCKVCGPEIPSVSDKDERCPKWGETGFCSIKKHEMRNLCPYSCKKYAGRHYTVKFVKPPKRRSPRPKPKPKPLKPTARPTPPLTEDEKEDMKEAQEEYAEEEEARFREKEEQRRQNDEGVTPLPAPPVVDKDTHSSSPDPAQTYAYRDNIDIGLPSEYEGGKAPTEKKKQ